MRHILWALTIFFSLSLHGFADECDAIGVSVGFPKNSFENNAVVRVKDVYRDVLRRAALEDQKGVLLCDTPFALLTAFVIPSRDENTLQVQHGIVIPLFISEQLTDEEMRGTIAHELGHVKRSVLGMKQDFKADSSAFKANEMACDALAARWVGAEAVIKGLLAVARIAMPHQKTDASRAAIQLQVVSRIHALRSLSKQRKRK